MSGLLHPHVPEHGPTSPGQPSKFGPETTPSIRLQQLTTMGQQFKFDSTIKVEAFLRSLPEMMRSAANYCDIGQSEQAYILYIRFLTLSVEKIPFHPGFKDLDPSVKNEMKAKAGDILTKADTLKAKLLAKFTAEHEKYLLELSIRHKVREAEEERLKELDRERDDLKGQREDIEKRLEELKLEKKQLETRWTEVKRERKELIAKRKQDNATEQFTDNPVATAEKQNNASESDEDNGHDEVVETSGDGDK